MATIAMMIVAAINTSVSVNPVAPEFGWGVRQADRSERYSVHPLARVGVIQAIKLDKKTGQTWLLNYHGYWTNGPAPLPE